MMRFGSVLAALVLGLASSGLGAALAQDQGNSTFGATLTGHEEVPPTDSSAMATATFVLVSHDQIEYTLELTQPTVTPITQAHIHVAPAGQNGPVVVNLCGTPDTEPCGTAHVGVIAHGTITADRLVGPLAGLTLADLLAAIQAGNTYANIHTTANPGGEIRGQIHLVGEHAGAMMDDPHASSPDMGPAEHEADHEAEHENPEHPAHP